MQSVIKNMDVQHKNDESLKSLRHDMKNHLVTIQYLIENNQLRKAIDYTKNLSTQYTQPNFTVNTGHIALDGLLTQKINDAENNNIPVTINADYTYIDSIKDIDLCVIFGNALDNAIEACQKIKNIDERFIDIKIHHKANYIFIVIKNAYSGFLEKSTLKTTKKDNYLHGIGLKNIRATVKQYNGYMNIHTDDSIHQFILTLSLPIV
ncbi:MAG: GHKL domain-containing protein [Erysipelotrichaceae bacterium]|nr:GHKL domain-containing protein [Erysipelotrichaceae bacterium]